MKKIKVLASVMLVGSMLFAMAGCGAKVSHIEKKEFKKILKNELDLEEDEDFYIYNHSDSTTISASYNRVTIRAAWSDDEDDAYDSFEEVYEDLVDALEDGDFKGDCDYDFQDTTGYILVDGKMDGEFAYGGFFFCDDMIIEIYTSSKKESAIEDTNTVLKAFDLPTP